MQLLRTLDPRPGAQIGEHARTHLRHARLRDLAPAGRLAGGAGQPSQAPRIAIHRGYEQMIRRASAADAGYLRGRLQEARWLLKGLESRGGNPAAGGALPGARNRPGSWSSANRRCAR